MAVFTKQGGNYADEFATEMRPAAGGARLYFQVVDNCAKPSRITSNAVLALNTWYHIAYVWDRTDLKLYVNGVLDNSYTGVGQEFNFREELQIGHFRGDPGNQYSFVGMLDEVKIWNVAHSESDLLQSIGRPADQAAAENRRAARDAELSRLKFEFVKMQPGEFMYDLVLLPSREVSVLFQVQCGRPACGSCVGSASPAR